MGECKSMISFPLACSSMPVCIEQRRQWILPIYRISIWPVLISSQEQLSEKKRTRRIRCLIHVHVSGDLKKMSTELFLVPNYMKMVRFSTANYWTYESHNLLKMQNEAALLMLISLYSIKILSGEIFKIYQELTEIVMTQFITQLL